MVETQGGYEEGGVDGSIGARAPVNRGWKGRPWLCRRGRLKGLGVFGVIKGGEAKELGWQR